MRLRNVPTFSFPSGTARAWKSILETVERGAVAVNNVKPTDLAIADVPSSEIAVDNNQAVTLTPLVYAEDFVESMKS